MVYNSPNKEAKPRARIGVLDIKKAKEPLVCLTVYTAYQAKLIDEYCDILLVGDSLGMVIYGFDSTLAVSLEMMINHGRAVVNSSSKAMVVVDMPFSSYEASPQQAYENAAKIMQSTNCQAIKLEGGEHMAPTIEFLTKRGIPVMAHIGLTPQSINSLGGFKIQGKQEDSITQLKKDLAAVESAGSFSVVIEAVREAIATELAEASSIPTIGIGASPNCNGQILVTEDMLGYFERVPKFVRRYAQLGEATKMAVEQYADDVRAGKFPASSEVYS